MNQNYITPKFLVRLKQKWIGDKAQKIILISFALLFTIIFVVASIRIHDVIGTSAYDLGIFDQAFWLFSRLYSGYCTVRGLHILGDHFSPIAYIFGPLYWIWPDITWALLLQTLAETMAGIMLYFIARELLPRRTGLALIIVASYYVNPAVHNTLLWQYHDLVLASGLYMLLIWSYLKNIQRIFFSTLVLLLMCREDMPFTTVAFGVLAMTEGRWRYGIWIILLSIVWWFAVTLVAMPYFNGGIGYFRHSHGALASFFGNITNPRFYYDRLADPDSHKYLAQLFLPVGIAGLFSPSYLLPALPTLIANLLIGGYMTNINFHYCISIMPFVYWASLMTLKKLDKVPFASLGTYLLAGMMFIGSGWLYHNYSVINLRAVAVLYRDWKGAKNKRELLKVWNKKFGDDGVAASDFLVPHLTHRKKIYLFPNPWQNHYWGVDGEAPHHPNEVKHIVLSRDSAREYQKLYDYLIEKRIFRVVEEKYGIIVMSRIKSENDDRAVAVNNFHEFSQIIQPVFTNISLSRVFFTPENQFDKLDINLSALQANILEGDVALNNLSSGDELKLELGKVGQSDFMTRYIRTELYVAEVRKAFLDLGSDDGVTVWVNQRLVHHNIVLRTAAIDDDHITFNLEPGKNVIVFRVNNATGAWILNAHIRTRVCDPKCS